MILGVAPLPASFCSLPLTPVDEVARVTLNLQPAGQQVSFGVCDNFISNRHETHCSPPTSGVFLSLCSGHTVVKTLMAKFGLIRRVWTPLKVGFPSCSAAPGADTSNDDEDEWDYNTKFSTRSELNTIAAIAYVRDRVRTGTLSRESQNWCRHSVTISYPEILLGFVHVEQTQKQRLI